MDNPQADNGLARTILSLGEERMGELLNQLLANERFVQAMQTAVASSLNAKRSVDKGLTRVLTLVNVPTLEDVDELRDKLHELEDLLAEIHDRVRRLDERLADREASAEPSEKAPAKKASSKKTKKQAAKG